MSILDTTFAVETADRAIKSFAQGVVLAFAASDVTGVNAFAFDWRSGLGFGLGAAVMSVLTSFISGSVFKRAATPASILSAPPLPADDGAVLADRGESTLVTILLVLLIVVIAIWLLGVYR